MCEPFRCGSSSLCAWSVAVYQARWGQSFELVQPTINVRSAWCCLCQCMAGSAAVCRLHVDSPVMLGVSASKSMRLMHNQDLAYINAKCIVSQSPAPLLASLLERLCWKVPANFKTAQMALVGNKAVRACRRLQPTGHTTMTALARRGGPSCCQQ